MTATMNKAPDKILILLDFSDSPGGRFRDNGPFSGEEYRETVVRPAMRGGDLMLFDLTGALAIAPSFLDEAFGQIVKEIGKKEFRRRFSFRCDDDPDTIKEIERIIESPRK